LADVGSISKTLQTSHYHTMRHKRGILRETNTITAAKGLLADMIWNAGKAAGCYEIRPEMYKALNRSLTWLTRVGQVAWCSGMAPTIG